MHAVFYLLAYLSVENGLRRVGSRDVATFGYRAEIFFDESARFRRVEVAGDDETRVVGHVVVSEEVLHVFERGRREVFHRADCRPVVRMALRVHRVGDAVDGLPVRLVVDALALLVLDNVALVVELRLRHRVEQSAHTPGLHEERGFEKVRRDEFPVVRAVFRGRAVDRAAELLYGGDVVEVVALEALEHHVLEEVCEACAARRLVLRADVIPDVDADDGRRVVFVEDDAQPVRQEELRVLDGREHRRGLRSRRRSPRAASCPALLRERRQCRREKHRGDERRQQTFTTHSQTSVPFG